MQQKESAGPQPNFLLLQATVINGLDAYQVALKQKSPLLGEITSFSSFSLFTARLQDMFLVSKYFQNSTNV